MCLFFRFLFWLLPFRGFRAAILRIHIDRCGHCREEYEIEEMTKGILAVPGWIKTEPSLWPRIRNAIVLQEEEKNRNRKRAFSLKKWQWAAAGLFLAGAVALIIRYQKTGTGRSFFEQAAAAQELPQVTIKYAEINGKNAVSYVYQTPTISFIWFSEPAKNGE